MDKMGHGYRAKNGGYDMNGVGIGLNSHTLLIIRVPDSWVLRIISRSLFLAMIILALPSIGSMLRASPSNVVLYGPDAGSGFKILPVLLRDLVDEGLIKKGQKGFVLGDIDDDLQFLKDAGIDLLTGADLRQANVIDHQVFDFVFALSFRGIQMIDGILGDNGLVISQLGHDPLNELKLLRDYKIVYLRRFEYTVAAMRKGGALSSNDAKHVTCGVSSEDKKAALKGLEDVYLEPPRRANLAKKTGFTSRKIKFLPDLLKDSLDEYPRRVFISDDTNALGWFYKNYPMRDQEFEMYNVEVGASSNDESPSQLGSEQGISSWLTKNVRREDYVVMKAEAQVVEEMIKDKTLCLVDELFLECKNQWVDGSRRAYWQCLALYGKVRDEGIAVHQWWN